MESAILLKQFSCPFHPQEVIQRICFEESETSPLLCLDCILQRSSNKDSLVPFPSFVQKAANFYARNNSFSLPIGTSAPNEFVEFLSQEEDVIANLTQHIDSQKETIEDTFKKALEIINTTLTHKKNELFEDLDRQLLNMKANFAYYKAKINQFYASPESQREIPNTEEKFMSIVNTFEKTENLEAYVRQTIEEMFAKKALEEESRIAKGLKTFSIKLKKQIVSLSECSIDDQQKREEFLNKLKDQCHSVVSESLTGLSEKITKISFWPQARDLDIQNIMKRYREDQEAFLSLSQLANENEEILNEIIYEFAEDKSLFNPILGNKIESKEIILLVSKLIKNKGNKILDLETRIKCFMFICQHISSLNQDKSYFEEALEGMLGFISSLSKSDLEIDKNFSSKIWLSLDELPPVSNGKYKDKAFLLTTKLFGSQKL